LVEVWDDNLGQSLDTIKPGLTQALENNKAKLDRKTILPKLISFLFFHIPNNYKK